MKKKSGKTLMQKWKNKIGGKLSALDKKKLVLTNIPYALAAFYADRAFFLYRNSPGEDMGNKLLYAMEHADRIFAGFVLSNNWKDLLAGIVVAVVLKVLVWQKQADAKKLRKGIEYGSARWGTAEDIKPYMSEDPWMNIPLTATEALTMESRPKQPKYARNKNIVVIGGSGSGKTRFFVKPSVMQMNCSMVITDPKGTLIEECGKMLAKGPPKKDKNGNIMKDKSGKVVHEPYVIKVLNTINFSKSLHYNPFAYIRSEKDILKLVTTIIVNTKGEGEKASEDFWVKAEKLLYTALIAFIWYEGKEEEKNLNTLLDLLNESETREEDETYQNPVDMLFEELEAKEPQHFAVRQYKKYKMAAGKTAKSILISCGARLAPFDIAELREIMSYDEMELDKIGDRKTALFLIMSDTDTTFNFVIAMLQSQLAQYISDCKNPSKNQMHSNAGNQTRNSYTVVYIFGDNENEIRDVLIEKLSASNISCKRVGGQEIIERCHEDISVKKKYIIAFSEMASLCITKASELLGENIIINRIFLINPSKAKESDLYLGDISIIDGNSVAIKSWEKAVLGNVREFESNSNDIFDIIMRELENDK